MKATALIAEDEPLLAASLRQELQQLWPDLQVLAEVPDGQSAVQETLQKRPQIVFLDIRMPGMSGLEAAQAIAEDWPGHEASLPLIVFVTAYDQHALDAFELAAVDYVLKPVQTSRLARTCQRLQLALKRQEEGDAAEPMMAPIISQLRALIQAERPRADEGSMRPPLRVLQASQGQTLHMIPVDEVIYFEAADKYVRVVTAQSEHLLRMSLKELAPRLPADQFWQIHRSTLVRADAIATARREETGRYTLTLKDLADKLTVSRLYAHLFKAM
ncbi:MAG TPA: LytTR family DNA-binding domain-containing protein [Aquabacterium sp.]|uniref:LytR/AlgR family response regulator transcription factor n=1 Tax=Aquabacterium sp. TaxID=1872578 RepID=UPI002E3705DE|nr:LytTR family DNA-binding domain-containing protein [Aquabacterium sp.]HEX5355368.1 LytTR family DNA-binding domain-containing protein [Aquabacterium sp.]